MRACVIRAGRRGWKVGEYIDTVFTRLLTPALFLSRLPGLASQCAVCRSWPARQVCPPCVSRFAAPQSRCSLCALALPADLSMGLRTGHDVCASCAIQRPVLDGALAALPYAYPWSNLIARYKFGEQPGWAGFFAALLLKTPGVQQAFADLTAQDWLLPMPLSAQRLQTRGFNQAWELASALARQSQSRAQADATLLLRVKHGRPQSQLKRQARLANVRGAFLIDPLRLAELQGRRVLLVDDVMTSGASMFAAAQALREAGAAHIAAVVLARTAPA
ncbi:comF family protein [Polaromonas sp. OV174]|uniref:ComF family protein n=1 Tax=Polaromonas sp. OV174 TaxID=1855300 RepID=UPI0008DF261D|nr:ComF family protein [Polaromonas sp. OV174]SFC51097.1 comF family protein [Polaromonas sp. OV174]